MNNIWRSIRIINCPQKRGDQTIRLRVSHKQFFQVSILNILVNGNWIDALNKKQKKTWLQQGESMDRNRPITTKNVKSARNPLRLDFETK